MAQVEVSISIENYETGTIRLTSIEGSVRIDIVSLMYALQQLGPFKIPIDYKDWKGMEGK